MRTVINRRSSDIISKIKSGRYIYDSSKDSLYDTKLKEDVSDLLNGIDKSNLKGFSKKDNRKPISEDKPVEEVKDETINENEKDDNFMLSEYKDKHFAYLSIDNTMIISLEHAPFTNLKEFKISKEFNEESMEKSSINLPHLSYEDNDNKIPTSHFNGEKILEIMNFIKEVEKKKKINLDKIQFYVKNNYPITIISEYQDEDSPNIKWRILFILANMIGD